MARYRKQKTFTELPGLFDELEIDMTGKAKQSHSYTIGGEKVVNKSTGNDATKIDRNTITNPDKIYFITLGSGSSGNCSYIGDSNNGFLIDAGVDMKKVVDGLNANGIPMER